MIDFYGRKLNTYKASLHTHSTTSDGRFTPKQIVDIYRDNGYGFFVFTDHRKSNRVSEIDGGSMTLISGMEMHPMGPRGLMWHFVAIGTPEDFHHPELSAQETIDAAVASGAYVTCAHPYWCGFTSAEVATLKNISAIEVYNSSTRYIGREFNMQLWDELSDMGIVYPAVAVDDTHNPRDLFRGWSVIAAPNQSREAFMNALHNGDFYSTQGPTFSRISLHDNLFEAEFSPCVSVIGLSNPSRGYLITVPDILGPKTNTPEITSCSIYIKIQPDKPTWFRLQIMDKNGKYAWSNPIVFQPPKN